MHLLLGFSSLLLVMLGGLLVLRVLPRVEGWSRRRALQFLVLSMPIINVGLLGAAFHHFTGRTCFIGAPPWDYLLALALMAVVMGAALMSPALGLFRLVLVGRIASATRTPADIRVQKLADSVAELLRLPRVMVYVSRRDVPLAITYGLRRPRILLSTWMVENLDEDELAAVLAHELGHVVRRDYLVMWLATMLRDAFGYFPTSWVAYRRLQREKELACDALAVRVTGQPLALASALVKVWHRAVGGTVLETAQPLTGASEAIEERVKRLLSAPPQADEGSKPQMLGLGVGVFVLVVSVLSLQIANVGAMLAPMGCGLGMPLGNLL